MSTRKATELGTRRRLPSRKVQEQAETETKTRKLVQATAAGTPCKRAKCAPEEARSLHGSQPRPAASTAAKIVPCKDTHGAASDAEMVQAPLIMGPGKAADPSLEARDKMVQASLNMGHGRADDPSRKAQEQAETETETRKLVQATAAGTPRKRARRDSEEARSSHDSQPGPGASTAAKIVPCKDAHGAASDAEMVQAPLIMGPGKAADHGQHAIAEREALREMFERAPIERRPDDNDPLSATGTADQCGAIRGDAASSFESEIAAASGELQALARQAILEQKAQFAKVSTGAGKWTLRMEGGQPKFTWSQPLISPVQGKGHFVITKTVVMHFAVSEKGIWNGKDGTGLCSTFKEFEDIYRPILLAFYELLQRQYEDILELSLFVVDAASICALSNYSLTSEGKRLLKELRQKFWDLCLGGKLAACKNFIIHSMLVFTDLTGLLRQRNTCFVQDKNNVRVGEINFTGTLHLSCKSGYLPYIGILQTVQTALLPGSGPYDRILDLDWPGFADLLRISAQQFVLQSPTLSSIRRMKVQDQKGWDIAKGIWDPLLQEILLDCTSSLDGDVRAIILWAVRHALGLVCFPGRYRRNPAAGKEIKNAVKAARERLASDQRDNLQALAREASLTIDQVEKGLLALRPRDHQEKIRAARQCLGKDLYDDVKALAKEAGLEEAEVGAALEKTRWQVRGT